MQAAGEMGKSQSNDCWENRHMDHPWDRSSPEQEPLGIQKDCTVPGMEPASHSHSFEGCTAVSGLAVIEATGHSAGDCTSGAAGIGQHTTL